MEESIEYSWIHKLEQSTWRSSSSYKVLIYIRHPERKLHSNMDVVALLPRLIMSYTCASPCGRYNDVEVS